MKITIVCPSRGRPERFITMAESAFQLAAEPRRVRILLGVDRDDPAMPRYAEIMPHGCTLLVNEEKRAVPTLMDWLAKESRGDLVYSGADDLVFRSFGWDVEAERAFAQVPDRLLVAYTNDLLPPVMNGLRRGVTHFFASREWIDVVGHFMAHDFEHFGGDAWVERIAGPIGRLQYLEHVHVEHMHKKYRGADGRPKAPNDETYQAKRQQDPDGSCMSERDLRRLDQLAPQIAAAQARVRAAMARAA